MQTMEKRLAVLSWKGQTSVSILEYNAPLITDAKNPVIFFFLMKRLTLHRFKISPNCKHKNKPIFDTNVHMSKATKNH